jgi:hypothetical protein
MGAKQSVPAKTELERRALSDLLESFKTAPISFGADEGTIANSTSVESAKRFLKQLPDEISVPQAAPDEGGVIFVWGDRKLDVVVSFIDEQVFIVIGAGGFNSTHLGPLDAGDPKIVYDILLECIQ